MYRFALRPGWVLTHLLVVAVLVSFVWLGFWQLRRHDERAAHNDRVAAQLEAPPIPLGEVLAEGGDAAYRRVTATGEYRPDDEVLLSPRSHADVPGHHLLTPFATTDGAVVLVDRGWVPIELDDPPVEDVPPPAGQVTIEGWLEPTGTARQAGPVDAPRLTFLSAVDPQRLGGQVAGPLVDEVYLVLDDPDARTSATLPRPAPEPDLDPGPHLGYAGQWFAFAVVVAVGYPLLLRRRAADRAGGGVGAGGGPDAAPPAPEPPSSDRAAASGGRRRSQ